MARILMIIAGCISLGLGCIGVFVPVLPTTPLVLLAAFLFAKSSPRLHSWIKSTWVYRNYVDAFLQAGGMPVSTKIRALLISYAVMGVSAFFVSVKSSASSRFKGALCTISVDFLLLSVQSDCREKPRLVAGANSSAFFFCSELLERYHQLTLLFYPLTYLPRVSRESLGSFHGKFQEFIGNVSGAVSSAP